MSSRYYVGNVGPRHYEMFRSAMSPTALSHGHWYKYVIGSFRTKKGAMWLVKYPYSTCQTVGEIERAAAREKSADYGYRSNPQILSGSRMNEADVVIRRLLTNNKDRIVVQDQSNRIVKSFPGRGGNQMKAIAYAEKRGLSYYVMEDPWAV